MKIEFDFSISYIDSNSLNYPRPNQADTNQGLCTVATAIVTHEYYPEIPFDLFHIHHFRPHYY
jgi:hypothetical protein